MLAPQYFDAVRAVAATQNVVLDLAPGVQSGQLVAAGRELGFDLALGLRQAWLLG